MCHAKIWESPKQKLLGVLIDRDLNFDGYISSLCRKVGKKLSALARLSRCMSLKQRRVLMESFIEAQFDYCQLIWMFPTRELNRKINHITNMHYELSTETTVGLSQNWLKKITQSVFTIETSNL